MKFRQHNRQREMGLGSASVVPLADARRRRDDARKLIAEGRDPIAERKKPDPATAKALKCRDFADALIPELVKGYRNEKHKAQWTSTLATYAASLRTKSVADITTDDVLAVLTPIWTDKNETAACVRGRIEKVLDAAKARGLRTGENPARWRGHLDQLLSKRRKLTRGHHEALPFAEVPSFVASLRERKGISALALEFTILTASRIGPVLTCPWSEIDRKAKVWTVQASRMKAGRDPAAAFGEQCWPPWPRLDGPGTRPPSTAPTSEPTARPTVAKGGSHARHRPVARRPNDKGPRAHRCPRSPRRPPADAGQRQRRDQGSCRAGRSARTHPPSSRRPGLRRRLAARRSTGERHHAGHPRQAWLQEVNPP